MTMDLRNRLWLNIMEDLGPPEGCIVPLWLACIYALLFPLQGARVLLDRSTGFDWTRLVWRINGLEFSAQTFARLATARGGLYRFKIVQGVMTIELIHDVEAET